MLEGPTAGLGRADALIVDGPGRPLFISDGASVLAGQDPHDVAGARCWELMGLRSTNGTPFCGPSCQIRERLDAEDLPRVLRLLRKRAPEGPEEVDLVTFVLPSTNEANPLILHLVIPVACARKQTHSEFAPDIGSGPASTNTRTEADARSKAPRRFMPVADLEFGRNQLSSSLTNREREVLDALANGFDSRAIAERLFISPVTVKHHVQNIMGKLGVHRRIDAILAWVSDSTASAGRDR